MLFTQVVGSASISGPRSSSLRTRSTPSRYAASLSLSASAALTAFATWRAKEGSPRKNMAQVLRKPATTMGPSLTDSYQVQLGLNL